MYKVKILENDICIDTAIVTKEKAIEVQSVLSFKNNSLKRFKMNNKPVKTIKSFSTVNEIVEYCADIECTLTEEEVRLGIERDALIKYGSILILFDPYGLLD